MKISLTLLAIILASNLLHAQNFTGKLVDKNEKPIPYAHIVYEGTTKGTISNDSGYFQLKYIDQHPSLHISVIGFEDKTIKVSGLNPKQLNLIQLKDSKVSMDEVVVRGSFDSAGWYVQKAIKNIRKNYPRKKHSQIAFYREATIRDTTYARMVDAIVLLSERGINRKSEDTRYEVLRKRKTKDQRDISWGQTLQNWLYQDLGPYTVNKSNPTKPMGAKNTDSYDYYLCNAISDDRRDSPQRLLYNEFVNENDFKITREYKTGGKVYIEIKTLINDSSRFDFNKSVQPVAKMIICKNDFAIVQFEKIQKTLKKETIFTAQTISKGIRAHYLIRWKRNPKDGKYYVHYIRDASVGDNSSRLGGIADMQQAFDTNFKYGFVRQVNEWYVIENRDYERISWWKGASLDEDIYDVESTKRLGFTFEDINAMPINPINQKMLEDLTNNGSIDELFIEE